MTLENSSQWVNPVGCRAGSATPRRRSGMNRRTRIAVVGAGLGGLTVAGFLQRAGFAVTVYEQASTFSRIGAGIILSANAMKVLRLLGVEDELIRTGIKPECFVSRAWDTGATITTSWRRWSRRRRSPSTISLQM